MLLRCTAIASRYTELAIIYWFHQLSLPDMWSMLHIICASLLLAMVDLRKQLARKLKTLRGDETQRAFARKLGIDASHLNRIEQGKENITINTIQKLCNSLKCSIGELFDDTTQPSS